MQVRQYPQTQTSLVLSALSDAGDSPFRRGELWSHRIIFFSSHKVYTENNAGNIVPGISFRQYSLSYPSVHANTSAPYGEYNIRPCMELHHSMM